MFDNLRDQANSTPFYEDEDQFREAEGLTPAAPPARKARMATRAGASSGRFLGMTPAQRFALALMLFITVCILGAMLLVVTGRIGLI